MTTAAVVRAKTPLTTTAITQDLLRSVTNCLTGQRFHARAISRIHHVAVPDAKMGPVVVSISGIDIVQS